MSRTKLRCIVIMYLDCSRNDVLSRILVAAGLVPLRYAHKGAAPICPALRNDAPSAHHLEAQRLFLETAFLAPCPAGCTLKLTVHKNLWAAVALTK